MGAFESARLVWALFAFLVCTTASVVPTAGASHQEQTRVGHFSVPVAQKANVLRNGPAALTAAYAKWGAPMSDTMASYWKMLKEDPEVIPVSSLEADLCFVADVGIGTPPQTVKMILDTGSADLWSEGGETRYSPFSEGLRASGYTANESSTSEEVSNALWRLIYADGSYARGKVYKDTLHLADGLTIHDMAIEAATIMSYDFEVDSGVSGLIGLAKNLSSTIRPPMPNLLDHLRDHLDDKVFTVDLRANSSTGKFEFGRIDNSSFKGDLFWSDNDRESEHWDFKFSLFRFEGMPEHHWWRSDFWGTADTGTTLLLLPGKIVSMYWAQVPGARADPLLFDSYVFDCSIGDSLPAFGFGLESGYRGTVPGKYINYGPLRTDNETCFGGIQSSDDFGVGAIIGDVLLKGQFVAFDFEKNRVGFAAKEGI